MSKKSVLVISTIQRDEIEIGLFDNKLKRFKCKTQDQSNDLLKTIEDVLKKEKILLIDLTAILVNISPGSYTGVRVGATVANTLAWSLDIPVLGYLEKDFEKTLQIAKNTILKFSKLALPTYLDVA